MAETQDDPREVPWHPRFAKRVLGHDDVIARFQQAVAAGKPHHAWLLHGPRGIGKATLAYHLAAHLLGGKDGQGRQWIESRGHPDLFVLERQLNDSKPRKLKSEISVEDARGLASFLSRTAAGEWRVVIIDAADDLNSESANAILKLVEEPPPKTVIFLVSHQPGRLLRTLKSRCLRVATSPLSAADVADIVRALPLDPQPASEDLSEAIEQSQGSPGVALILLRSPAAKAFAAFRKAGRLKNADILGIAAQAGGRGAGPDDFEIFTDLLLDWVANRAKDSGNANLAEAHAALGELARISEGFNLDRRQAIVAQLTLVNACLEGVVIPGH